MIRLIFFFFSISCFYKQVYAQVGRSFSDEMSFVNHLTNNAEYHDIILLLGKVDESLYGFSQAKKDSFNYYLGWSHYNIKSFDTSSFHLGQVSLGSPFYLKSKFYEGLNAVYTGKTAMAKPVLLSINTNERKELNQLRLLDLAGIALLERNYIAFDSLSALFDFNFIPIALEQKTFLKYSAELLAIKKKSPLLAGIMSAFIPGSGKYYTGYKGQAVSAFITTMTFAAVAAENYSHAGPQSAQFIIFAGVFGLFYVGNIWGSVLSVKIRRNELYRKIDHEILLDLHLPLHRIFK